MPPWSKKPPLEPEVSPYAATNATVWLKGDWTLGNYLLTLCSPSVTLQPFEYCLPFDSVFDDVDEDHYTAELENWHEFVKDTCGVKLTVRAVRETDPQS